MEQSMESFDSDSVYTLLIFQIFFKISQKIQ